MLTYKLVQMQKSLGIDFWNNICSHYWHRHCSPEMIAVVCIQIRIWVSIKEILVRIIQTLICLEKIILQTLKN